MLRRRTDTPELAAYWRWVAAVAQEVAAWMRGEYAERVEEREAD